MKVKELLESRHWNVKLYLEMLEDWGVENYDAKRDGFIHIYDEINKEVKLNNLQLTKLPFYFHRNVNNIFHIAFNQLTSLEGCPPLTYAFDCSHNDLISLEGGPKQTWGHYACNHNKLQTLKGAAEFVDGYFYCDDNQIISLEGAPRIVTSYFSCEDNKRRFSEQDVRDICKVTGAIFR